MTIPFHCGVTISRVSFVYWQLWLIEWVGNRTNPGTGFQKTHRGSFPSLVYKVEQRTRHSYHTPRPLLPSHRNTTQVQMQPKRHLWSTLFILIVLLRLRNSSTSQNYKPSSRTSTMHLSWAFELVCRRKMQSLR